MKLKIAVAVHGRFHGFDRAKSLLKRGHDVTVFTNYPKWAAARFGLPPSNVRSFWPHGVVCRVAEKLNHYGVFHYPEPFLHDSFSRWVNRELQREAWDVIHSWSGVTELIEHNRLRPTPLVAMMRGSAHIRTQARLLQEETIRTGVAQNGPSDWMIARETREYDQADCIVTLSTFAHASFLAEGVPAKKLECVPLGAALDVFRPPPEVIEARCQRILSGQPLRVLYVGTLSYRKGLHDLATMAENLAEGNFRLQLVGPLAKEARAQLESIKHLVDYVPKQPQAKLPDFYAQGDVFVFPTIEDGYAAVLAQASASGLPVLTTTNCGGPDLLQENQTGWVLPIRQPEAFIERLLWCDAHRPELAAMMRHAYTDFQPRRYDDVADDFEAVCRRRIAARTNAPSGGR